jgi:putative NADH-flavin reductase
VVAVKVLIVGATGGLGMEMLRRAPERGHEATALARDPSTVQGQDERLRAVRGDVLDPASVESAVRGQDAVLSALGTPNPRKPSTLLSEGTKNLVDAMKRNGVERLVCVTILGTGDSGRRHGRLFYKLFVLGYFVKPMLEDKERQEVVIRQSGLEWTIVRPPRYTDEPESGNYRVITDSGGRIGKIGRKDLAGFMLVQLDDTSHVRRAVAVGY